MPNVGDFAEIDLVGDVAPRLAFRPRNDGIPRGIPRSERRRVGGVSVAERRELRATAAWEACPTAERLNCEEMMICATLRIVQFE